MGQKDSWGVKLPRINRVKKGGRVYKFHRPTGARLPDHLPETHPEFISAWATAEASSPAGKVRGAPGSVSFEAAAYLASSQHTGLSAVYKRAITKDIEAIRCVFGDLPMKGLRSHHIEADMAKLTPDQANKRRKAWRNLCKSAKKRGAIKDDPSIGTERVRVETDGYAPWSADEIAQFRARWPVGTVARACFEFVFWTALRTIDAVRVGPQHVGKDGIITLRQSKTRGDTYVPWTASLPAFAQAWEAERRGVLEAVATLSGGLTFLQAHNHSRSVKGLGNVIRDGAAAAGIEGRSAHGLRKSRLTMIAEAGGSTYAIKAWGGHKSLKEAQRYTDTADTKRLIHGAEQEQNDANRSDNSCKPLAS